MAYIEPLSQFLQLDKIQKDALTKRLSKKGKMPSRKAHKLTQYRQCKDSHLSEAACYQKVRSLIVIYLFFSSLSKLIASSSRWYPCWMSFSVYGASCGLPLPPMASIFNVSCFELSFGDQSLHTINNCFCFLYVVLSVICYVCCMD